MKDMILVSYTYNKKAIPAAKAAPKVPTFMELAMAAPVEILDLEV